MLNWEQMRCTPLFTLRKHLHYSARAVASRDPSVLGQWDWRVDDLSFILELHFIARLSPSAHLGRLAFGSVTFSKA